MIQGWACGDGSVNCGVGTGWRTLSSALTLGNHQHRVMEIAGNKDDEVGLCVDFCGIWVDK